MRSTACLAFSLLLGCGGDALGADAAGRDGGSGGTDATTTAADTGPIDGGGDVYAAARIACLDAINALRATQGSTPYTLWGEASMCTDEAAIYDAANGAHASFGMCGENGQNECMGFGPENIGDCVRLMWAERDQPSCAGCDACLDTQTTDCPNCDFFGRSSPMPCGHYVNLAARYHTEVACGFLPPSFATMNFR